MGDIEKSARVAVGKLHDQIHRMSINLRSFCASLRYLHGEGDSFTAYSGAADMKCSELRDDTRDDAMVVLIEIISLSNNLITSDCYEGLEFDEWFNKMPLILKKTVAYRQLSEMLLQRYEATLVPLKKRQDHEWLVVTELKDLKRELEDTAGTKQAWALGLAFVPFVNLIATPALACSAASDIQEATRQGSLAEVQEEAARKVIGTLISALKDFVAGVSKAAGFFSVMEHTGITN